MPNEGVQYTISIKDLAGSKLDKIALAASKAETSIKSLQSSFSSLSGTISEVNKLTNSYNQLAQAITSANQKQSAPSFRGQRQAGGVSAGRGSSGGQFRTGGSSGMFGMGAGSSLKSVLGLGIAGYGIGELASGAANTTQTVAEYQRMEKAITISSDNIGQAEVSLAWIKTLSKDYGLPLKETTEGFKMWQGAIMGTTLSSTKAREVFGKFAKTFSVMGLDADRAKLGFMALGQMMSKGKISAEELNQQLSEHLPGATAHLAQSLGVTTSQLYKMMKAGELLSTDVLPKLADHYEKLFGADAAKSAETLSGKINTLANSFQNLKLAVGNSSEGGMSDFLTWSSNVLNAIATGFKSQEQVSSEYGANTSQRWLSGLEEMYTKKGSRLKKQGKSRVEIEEILYNDIEARKSKINRSALTQESKFLGGSYKEQYGNKFVPLGRSGSNLFMKDAEIDAYNNKNEDAKKHAEIVQGMYKTAKALDAGKIVKGLFAPQPVDLASSSGSSSKGSSSSGGRVREQQLTHINITVGNLVEMKLSGVNANEVVEAVKREVPKALLTTLNDANIIMTQRQR